jgi:hypothetical protein
MAGFADVAQLVEHSLGKGEVTSSILVIGSTKLRRFADVSEPAAEIPSEARDLRLEGIMELAGARILAEG